MASPKFYFSMLIFTLCLLLKPTAPLTSSSLSSSSSSSVYDVLKKYGLPSGLLPSCVTSYTLSEEDGSFVVTLNKPCYVQFDYLVYYDKKITGTLKYGSITDLKGIQVKSFLFWFDVDEIKVDLPPPSDHIYFQVGIINKKLDVDQFEKVHHCRGNVLKLRSWKIMFEFPPINNEIPMLLTE